MADPHHVQYDQALPSGNSVFGESHESYDFNSAFHHQQGHNVAFEPGWPAVDPSLPQHHGASYANTSLASNWVPQSSAYAQDNTFTTGSPYYGQQFSTAAPNYQNFTYPTQRPSQYAQSVDPSLLAAADRPIFGSSMDNHSFAPRSHTISPAALQSDTSAPGKTADQQQESFQSPGQQQQQQQQPPQPVIALPTIVVPKAAPSPDGRFLIIDQDALADATHSKRFHNFLNIGEIPVDLPITKSTIPQYIPRKSINELRKLALQDPKLAAKLGKRKPKFPKVGVQKVGRPKLASTGAASPETRESPSESSSESESFDDGSEYESESEEEMPEPSPLPASRPSEPLQAVRYDTIKAVWLPRNVYAQAEQIRAGLKDFWEVVKTIRDRWKSDNEAVKKAVEAKKESELPLLKQRVKNQRNLMEMALRSALEHGHPDIIRLFGENKPLMFLFYQFLAERISDKEYSGSFTRVALKLLGRCSTLTVNVLEETKLNKAIVRFAKNGDDEIRFLAQQVTDKASVNSKGKLEITRASKTDDAKKDDTKVKLESPQKSTTPTVAGTKRSLGTDATNGQAAKRVASSTLMQTSGSSAGKAPPKRPVSTGTEKPSVNVTANTVTKTKVVSKTPSTNVFSSLSAHKKSSAASNATSTAKRVVASAVKPEKKIISVQKPAFSFAETMASLNKPQETESSMKPEETRPEETPEEKAKRLRKEERRKLRVSWKPDTSLVSVRIFQHDPEEELGHDANMVRDVGDVGSEGRMFKQHKDAMDFDEDDDEPMEQDFGEWRIPSLVDFSKLPEQTLNDNFQRYGGHKPAESPEKERQLQHEASTLMAHYFTRSDIPTCPREPADPYEGVQLETKIGDPPGPETIYAIRAAAFQKPAFDVNAILKGLGPLINQHTSLAEQPPASAPAPVQHSVVTNDQFSTLQNIFAQHSALTKPPPPQPQIAPQQTYMPIAQPAVQNPQLDSVLAILQAQNQQQRLHQPVAPPSIPPSIFTQPAPSAPPAQDPSALLAKLGLAPNLLSQFGQNQTSNQSQFNNDNNGVYENPARKRRREGDDQYPNQVRKDKKFTQKCKFWADGKCRKGADCTFLHAT